MQVRSHLVGVLVLTTGCGGKVASASEPYDGGTAPGYVADAGPLRNVVQGDAFGGISLSAASVVFRTEEFTTVADGYLEGEDVVFSNQPDVCDHLLNYPSQPGEIRLHVAVSPTRPGLPQPTVPLPLRIVPAENLASASEGWVALAWVQYTSPQCSVGPNLDATGGAVTLDAWDSERMAGTFDLRFEGGQHVTGSFDAPFCMPKAGTWCQ